jgi:hypothetical protein
VHHAGQNALEEGDDKVLDASEVSILQMIAHVDQPID